MVELIWWLNIRMHKICMLSIAILFLFNFSKTHTIFEQPPTSVEIDHSVNGIEPVNRIERKKVVKLAILEFAEMYVEKAIKHLEKEGLVTIEEISENSEKKDKNNTVELQQDREQDALLFSQLTKKIHELYPSCFCQEKRAITESLLTAANDLAALIAKYKLDRMFEFDDNEELDGELKMAEKTLDNLLDACE